MIKKKEFAAATFNPNHKAFIVYVAALNICPNGEIYPSKRAHIAHLKADKASTKVSSKYVDFDKNDFFTKFGLELSDHISINNHVIKLVDN